MAIKFGTEGWRAIMGEAFTADNVRLVTQAISEEIRARRKPKSHASVALGYDTRFLSDYFARVVAEVLVGNGFKVLMTKAAVPTCAVSRYVLGKHLPAGIVITASHNPAIYNGIKVKEAYGGSAKASTVKSIEGRFGRSPIVRTAFDEALLSGRIMRVDMMPGFLSGIRSYVDIKSIRKRSLLVIADAMHGTAGRSIEQLVGGGRLRVETINGDPDPLFGGQAPEPIASHLGDLSRTVRRRNADLGIANDGDADRIGIIGPGGIWLNPGQVMCVVLQHLVRNRQAAGVVIKTVSNTMMINRMTADLGLKLVEVPVGFKNIVQYMVEHDFLIGGEESGGIGVKGYLPERDGILNAVLLLEAMTVQRKSLSSLLGELQRRYGNWFYDRRDLHLKASQVEKLFRRLKRNPPGRMAGTQVVDTRTLDGIKLIGKDESWLLFRRSGTEPIVRIYSETPRKAKLNQLLQFGMRLARGS